VEKKILIKHICFDLDGTLVDSFKTILNSTLKTLKELNINSSITENDFRLRIGHHFTDIFKDLSIDVADIEHFINIYKQNYFSFINQSELYPGVDEILSELKQNNYFVSLLTTKTQDQAEKIIEHFNLTQYFDLIMGRRINLPVKPNPEPLIEICRELNIRTEETLMVGDTELDIVCGRNAGSYTCAVTYGYREIEKLKEEEADYYISSLNELKELINKQAIKNQAG
jgi:phosphoglycolate phosphatase/pyrophosphatase PpaX